LGIAVIKTTMPLSRTYRNVRFSSDPTVRGKTKHAQKINRIMAWAVLKITLFVVIDQLSDIHIRIAGYL
jgi:hypothetical protein